MKKALGVSILLIAAVTLWCFIHSKNSAPPPGTSTDGMSSAGPSGSASSSVPPSVTVAVTSAGGADSALRAETPPNPAANAGAVQPGTTAVPPPDIPPEIVLQNVRHAITQYGAMFGGNPVGTNPEITAALAGDNSKGINFIKPEAGMRINDHGELVDHWDTPLFFHQLSGSDTEVRSAGPDRKMWTPDDLVTR